MPFLDNYEIIGWFGRMVSQLPAGVFLGLCGIAMACHGPLKTKAIEFSNKFRSAWLYEITDHMENTKKTTSRS